jgi:phage tail sheath protein FI
MALTPTFPGVFIEEQPSGVHTIKGVATSIAAFVGFTGQGVPNSPVRVRSFADYQDTFGTLTEGGDLGYAVLSFFENGGADAYVVRVVPDGAGDQSGPPGTQELIAALGALDIIEFNLLSIPDATRAKPTDPQALDDNLDPVAIFTAALDYCTKRLAFLLVDPPPDLVTANDMQVWRTGKFQTMSADGALHFPRVKVADAARAGQSRTIPPSGTIAGVYARTDASRGVWKAPAGAEARLAGIVGLSVHLVDEGAGVLNRLGVNCIRSFPGSGIVNFGARTLAGADSDASEWKYIPVRRVALYIESSIYRGIQWASVEPNDPALWKKLLESIGVFMLGVFRDGAFTGATPREAFFVKCDSSTTTQADIDAGICNILVGFAPLRPAEFVLLPLQQMTAKP